METDNQKMESDNQVVKSGNHEIRLQVERQFFKANKNVLCNHSDYFSAMFGGDYVEKTKQIIEIELVDAKSMEIILNYMNIGQVNLSEFTLATVGNLAVATCYLQITQLKNQIEEWLDLQLSHSNWMEIMIIAERASYTRLNLLAGAFGLLSFKEMKPKHIPNINELFWYLSHPHLNTDNELDVFKFGYQWVLEAKPCPIEDIVLLVLGCLDVQNLTLPDLKELSFLMTECGDSLPAKVIDCLKTLFQKKVKMEICDISFHKSDILETFHESVYSEVYKIVKYSKKRTLQFEPIVPMWELIDGKLDYTPHYLYKFSKEIGFQKWINVADKDLWGWSIAGWGTNKLVHVCGEHGRGTGHFMRDVRVYDTLRDEWTQHGVQLPSRRHAGVTIAGDTLFIVGGVGGYRVLEDKAYTYDLKNRTYRKIANFPDAIQSPAICTHYGSVYAFGHKNIYSYDNEGQDCWRTVLKTEMRANRMISFKGYIYCSQNYFSSFFRFRPNFDSTLEMVTQFKAPAAAFCNIGNSLVVFTKSVCSHDEDLKVESFSGPCMCPEGTCNYKLSGYEPQILWCDDKSKLTVNEVAGACALVTSMPVLVLEPSKYHSNYLMKYGKLTYDECAISS